MLPDDVLKSLPEKQGALRRIAGKGVFIHFLCQG